MRIEERGGHEPADDRPRNADERRHDDSAGIVAGQDRFRDDAGEQPEDDECDDSHDFLLLGFEGIPVLLRQKTSSRRRSTPLRG